MISRHNCILCAVLALILIPATSHSTAESIPYTDKVVVGDGHVRHDLGDLWNHASNWGLIGSMPGRGASFSDAPSARWPGDGGLDHLFAAGLWVGAVVEGETLVTAAAFNSELLPTDAPGDTIQTAYRGMPGGVRYPWFDADDDGDGREDEDPLNNRDDDGDGLVDEDCAAIGDQHYFATYADTAAVLQETYPDHQPLGIEVLQQSFQWMDPLLAGVIGYDFTVTNVGDQVLEDVYCGLFADFDINGAEDDHAGGFRGLIRVHDGSFVPIDVGYMRDGAATPQGGWIGWVMCGLEQDVAPTSPGQILTANGFQVITGQQPFEQGGDPNNDSERYQLLATNLWDGDTLMPADRRTLLSAGPVTQLDLGESVTVRWALVVGADRDAMLLAAAEAVWTAVGRTFDRDEDPGNGEEFAVRWLSPDDQIVSVSTPRLRAGTGSGGVHLRCDLRGSSGVLAVERRAATGVTWRRWSGWDGRAEIIDTDPVGWPRTYDLLHRGADGVEKIVDTVEMTGPPPTGLRLDAGPNPFNPRLNISYYLPRAGSARLTVHSVRGDVVRVLHDGPAAVGEGTATWNGEDGFGRDQASGVYLVRLETAQRVAEQRVTLVR